jgi:hypothetical protein
MSGSLYSPNSQVPGASTESYVPDQLIAGQFFRVTLGSATLTGGQGVLARGTLLGQTTATGKYVVSTAAATDGSQVPSAILADTYDTTAGDVVGAGLYLTGEFNANRVTFGAGITAASAFAALRGVGIFLKSSISAADPS